MSFKFVPYLWAFLCLAAAAGQSHDEHSDAVPLELQALDRELTAKAQQLGDWSEQYHIVTDVINNIWEQNNWNTEADLFARDTALRIQRIAPWKFEDRMEVLVGSVKERYHFDENQTRQFQEKLYQEMWGLTLKYGPALMGNARDMLDTRLRGEPFTARQVARWARAFDPLMKDFEGDVNRIAADFGAMLTDEQRRIFERDLQSVNKRMTHFVQSSEAWKRGAWRAEDWGLQNDPIHQPENKIRLAQNALNQMLERSVLAHDESTWRRYVRGFITLYELDQAQRKACTTILDDMVTRAKRYRAGKGDDIKKLTPIERSAHALLEPVRTMFTELKSRLNVIPTENQRKQAIERAPTTPQHRRSTRRPRNPNR